METLEVEVEGGSNPPAPPQPPTEIAARAEIVTSSEPAADAAAAEVAMRAEMELAAAMPPAAAGAAAPLPADAPLTAEWRPAAIHLLGPLEVPGFAPRLVRVYLPSTFTPEVPRFALYMFDGQNVFDDAPSFSGGWHLHAAVEKIACSATRPAPIVVAIDHGGSDRIAELSPWLTTDVDGGGDGRLDALLDWIDGSLAPRLAEALPLIPGPLGTVIGGSSMGGLAAFYAHFRRPGSFGGALVMSPSFWLGDAAMLHWLPKQPTPEVSRVYLDCGVREGRGTLLPQVAAVAAQLQGRGYDEDHLLFRADARGAHSEANWRRRLPRALRFFYRPGV